MRTDLLSRILSRVLYPWHSNLNPRNRKVLFALSAAAVVQRHRKYPYAMLAGLWSLSSSSPSLYNTMISSALHRFLSFPLVLLANCPFPTSVEWVAKQTLRLTNAKTPAVVHRRYLSTNPYSFTGHSWVLCPVNGAISIKSIAYIWDITRWWCLMTETAHSALDCSCSWCCYSYDCCSCYELMVVRLMAVVWWA